METVKIGQENDHRKVILNNISDEDYIYLDASDSTFVDKFVNFIKYLELKSAELKKVGTEIEELYEKDESSGFRTDALIKLTATRVAIYKDVSAQLDSIFGQNVLKKYFRFSYEINPDFVPDDLAIMDFVEEIIPTIENIYETRVERVKSKYNRARKGRNK